MLDFTFASVLLAVAIVFLVSTSFAGAVVASVGTIAAVGDVCGAGGGGFDGGCICNSTREVRDVVFDVGRFLTYLRPRAARKSDLMKYILKKRDC
jgi:hypothetical protein